MSQKQSRNQPPTVAEYFEFLTKTGKLVVANQLLAEERGPTLAALTGLPKPAPKGGYLKSIKTHKVYLWLEEFTAFQTACATIESDRIRVNGWSKANDWEFRFSSIVAEHLWLFEFEKFHKVTPKFPDSATRTKAGNHAKQLLGLIKNSGVGLESYLDQGALVRNLTALQQELKQVKARPRKDGTLHERITIEKFCQSLHASFGAISPAIVSDFAAMIEYNAEKLELQINAVKKAIGDRERAASGRRIAGIPPEGSN